MKELLRMFLAFAKVGVCTFGGGYAMLPILQREIVEKRQWATQEELMDYYAIGQCTPGVIAVNTATFIGSKKRGVPGAISATLGVVAPSVVIITVIAAFIRNFQHIEAVQWAFEGIRAAVVALIASAVLKLGKKTLVDFGAVAIFLIVAALAIVTDLSPAIFVVAAGAVGLLLKGGTKRDASA